MVNNVNERYFGFLNFGIIFFFFILELSYGFCVLNVMIDWWVIFLIKKNDYINKDVINIIKVLSW